MTCLRSFPKTRLRKKRDVLGTRVIQGGKTLNAHFFGAAQKRQPRRLAERFSISAVSAATGNDICTPFSGR